MGLKYIEETKDTGSGKLKYLDELDLNPKETTGSLLSKTPQAMAALGLGVPAVMGAGKLLGATGRAVKMVPTALSANYGVGYKADTFANSVNEAFVKTHTIAVNKFGGDLEKWAVKNPNKSVDLTALVNELKSDTELSKQTAGRILNKTPKLDALIKDPNLVGSVSLKDSQEIVNHLRTKLKSGGYEIQEAINNVKGSQLAAFPEMAETNAAYAEFIEPYKQVKNYFKVNKILPGIENKFGGAQGNVRVEKILPKEIFKQINAYRAAVKATNPIKTVARGLMGGAGRFAGIAPMASQAFNLWRLKNDPEAQYQAMLGGEELSPKGSMERELQQGRIL